MPDGAVIGRAYAGHSTGDLPVSIAVDGVVLGEQGFDGLDRLVRTVTGGRERVFGYDEGMPQPARVTTPGGQIIEYDYTAQLGDEPVQRRLPGGTAVYDYDRQNARLVGYLEGGYEIRRAYSSAGHLRSEIRREGSEETAASYEHSFRGRLLSYTDVFGELQSHQYDPAGRLETFRCGTTEAHFAFDAFGRPAAIHTQDSLAGQAMDITLGYDALGRETSRAFTFSGVGREVVQTYHPDGAMASRTLTQSGAILRAETYDYDLRGRLEIYQCSGSLLPADPYGREIDRQIFIFDALNNIVQVTTRAPDQSVNTASYEYDPIDTVQLRRITNDHAAYPPEIVLDYGAGGDLSRDEHGRGLEYDALGRLTKVGAAAGGEESTYRYDALDILAGGTSGALEDRRFYRDGELANRIRGGQRSTFLRAGGSLLGERLSGGGSGVLLLATDAGNSVLCEAGADEASDLVYSAYGHRSSEGAATRLGYKGEIHEEETGWQLLGNGYRAYNPLLMRFHSPDSLSPFDEGGINAYAYCGGDPVNYSDPTGHFPFALLSLVAGVISAGTGVAAALTEGNTRTALTVVSAVAGLVALGSGVGAYYGRANAAAGPRYGRGAIQDPELGVTWLGKGEGAPMQNLGRRGAISGPSGLTGSGSSPRPASPPLAGGGTARGGAATQIARRQTAPANPPVEQQDLRSRVQQYVDSVPLGRAVSRRNPNAPLPAIPEGRQAGVPEITLTRPTPPGTPPPVAPRPPPRPGDVRALRGGEDPRHIAQTLNRHVRFS